MITRFFSTAESDAPTDVNRKSAAYKYGGDPMAEWLHMLSMDSLQDDETGETDWDFWCARFGKRLLFSNDQGRVWVEKHPSEQSAINAFNVVSEAYGDWLDGDVRATLDTVLARIKSYTAHQLSGDADCASPDSPTSAGAHFLTNVRDNVVERVEGFDADDLEALRSEVGTVQDVVSEIADEAPNVYTYTLWCQFVDLAAYNEDPTELGADGSDMEQSARVCLYMIAERLAQALFTEIHEALREA